MIGNPHVFFSAHLRGRPIWDVLLPIFDSATDITFENSSHQTYDIALYLPGPSPASSIQLHTMVVIPSCVEEINRQATLTRAENFVAKHVNGQTPSRLAVIFLISDTPFQTASEQYTVAGVVSLQVLLFDSPSLAKLPIITVAEPNELLPSLREHCHSLQRRLDRPPGILDWPSVSSSSLQLLEQIVAHGSEQHTFQRNLNILSDLFPSLRALSSAVRTVEGRQLIADYLGEDVARNIAAFWDEDWICG